MGCGGSTASPAQQLVSNPPLPKGHRFLAELAFLSEVMQGWRGSQGAPDHLAWIAVLGDGAVAKWGKEVTHTSTKVSELEQAGTTTEAFQAWVDEIGPAIEDKSISPYALQISWEVGKHAKLSHGELARF